MFGFFAGDSLSFLVEQCPDPISFIMMPYLGFEKRFCLLFLSFDCLFLSFLRLLLKFFLANVLLMLFEEIVFLHVILYH